MAKTKAAVTGAKKSYPVLDEIRHDGESYSPNGDNKTIELTDAQAEPLLAVKAIGAPKEEPAA
jgi:hypothetical protein